MKVDTVEISTDELAALRSDSSAHKCFLFALFFAFGAFGFIEIVYKFPAAIAYVLACWVLIGGFFIAFIGVAINQSIRMQKSLMKKYWWRVVKKGILVLVFGAVGPVMFPLLFPLIVLGCFFCLINWVFDLWTCYYESQGA